MVVVAQLVRALVCGTKGRRFEPGLPPKIKAFREIEGFYCFLFVLVYFLSTLMRSSLLANSQAVWKTKRARVSNRSYCILSGVSLGL